MALEQYAVRLTPDERERLSQLIRSGKSSARIVARARILLKVDEGWTAPQVAAALDVSKGTVYRAKRRYAEEGLDGVLQDRVQANRFRKLDDRGEAHLIALACSPAPAGHDHWTLHLLADRVVELGLVESLSHERETVGRVITPDSGWRAVSPAPACTMATTGLDPASFGRPSGGVGVGGVPVP